ncbi:MAG: hypothetical protein JSS64_07765 [Bacteroidetes bacterium]|nr:hypothetical protein [Bacteroidota bacterium]
MNNKLNMKYITKATLISNMFLFSSFTYSQNKDDLKFFSLTVIDTISAKAQIDTIQVDNEFEYENFFIKDWIDQKRFSHKALFCKNGDTCLVYDLPNIDNDGFGLFNLSNNNRFVTYNSTYGYGSRGHFEGTRTYYIIDLKYISCIFIRTYLRTESYDDNTENAIDSSCSLEIEWEGDILIVKRKTTNDLTYKKDFGEDCSPLHGKYKVSNGYLVRLKSNN